MLSIQPRKLLNTLEPALTGDHLICMFSSRWILECLVLPLYEVCEFQRCRCRMTSFDNFGSKEPLRWRAVQKVYSRALINISRVYFVLSSGA